MCIFISIFLFSECHFYFWKLLVTILLSSGIQVMSGLINNNYGLSGPYYVPSAL